MAVNKELAASDPHELRGALQVLETVLLGPDMEEPKRVGTGLRLTVYVPAPKDNETLVQVLDYVGCQRHPKAVGGKIRAGEGAVGRAYRNATLEPNRPKMVDGFRKTENYDDFVVEMTSEYGFSPERAAKLHPATMSWLAYPIAADGTVFGVLYCDSKRKDFFSEGRKRDFMHAVAGLAKFVSVRYPSKEAP